jgi:uncharacterized membrane protein YqaE (UPF0057 family)
MLKLFYCDGINKCQILNSYHEQTLLRTFVFWYLHKVQFCRKTPNIKYYCKFNMACKYSSIIHICKEYEQCIVGPLNRGEWSETYSYRNMSSMMTQYFSCVLELITTTMNSLVAPAVVCETILAFIFPPIAVFMVHGCGCSLVLNILLTLLGWIPGVSISRPKKIGRKASVE